MQAVLAEGVVACAAALSDRPLQLVQVERAPPSPAAAAARQALLRRQAAFVRAQGQVERSHALPS